MTTAKAVLEKLQQGSAMTGFNPDEGGEPRRRQEASTTLYKQILALPEMQDELPSVDIRMPHNHGINARNMLRAELKTALAQYLGILEVNK